LNVRGGCRQALELKPGHLGLVRRHRPADAGASRLLVFISRGRRGVVSVQEIFDRDLGPLPVCNWNCSLPEVIKPLVLRFHVPIFAGFILRTGLGKGVQPISLDQ
jgi:hypothetical protein